MNSLLNQTIYNTYNQCEIQRYFNTQTWKFHDQKSAFKYVRSLCFSLVSYGLHSVQFINL